MTKMTATVHVDWGLGTGSGRNARMQLRERITTSTIATASAVSECTQVAPLGVARFAADIIGSVPPACSEVKGRSMPRRRLAG
jgi:hypothetical protein